MDDVAVQLKRHRSTSQVVDGLKQGDLTFNHGNQSINLSVVIEKKSRYIKIIKNESKKALEIGKSLLNAVGSFPKNFPTAAKSRSKCDKFIKNRMRGFKV